MPVAPRSERERQPLASGANPSRHRLALRTGAVGECALAFVFGMGALDGDAPGAGGVGERAHPEVLRVGAFLSLAEMAGGVLGGRVRESSLAVRERAHVLRVRSAHRAPPNLIAVPRSGSQHPRRGTKRVRSTQSVRRSSLPCPGSPPPILLRLVKRSVCPTGLARKKPMRSGPCPERQ